ncbi:inositol monophosphatase 3 [Lingula anatina]|uniref:inositol-phosphate phosphatase n=1 Tax=Lingula anatina TaxID=7574 RepID=A0A1S3J347_LINAN|nr:inositol monophosphatase 3 [Lingula anatina]|eukprot:XP_013404701.1 inositol monophosphatase 3 [Lingula anatina]
MSSGRILRLNPLGILVVAAISGCILLYFVHGWFTPKMSMKEVLAASITLAKRGGQRVKEIRETNRLKEQEKGKTKEGAAEMLTEGDMQSHIQIMYGLAKTFPGLKVISEEHEKQTADTSKITRAEIDDPEVALLSDQYVNLKDVAVWIDPLDATQEYTEDLTQYVTVMVCVVVGGQPVMGVIHKPFLQETVWAWVGHGHSKNIRVEDDKEKETTSIIVSRSHAGDVEAAAKETIGQNIKVIPAGGAGYKTVEVIKGNADAYVHKTLIKKWDICAGNAIIKELGGRMTDLFGHDIDYSPEKNVKNEGGLLATTRDHDGYLKKLESMAKSLKQ